MALERKQVLLAGAAVGGVLGVGYLLTRGGGGGETITVGDGTAVQNLANSTQNALERLAGEWTESLASTREGLSADIAGVRTEFETQVGDLYEQQVSTQDAVNELTAQLGSQYGAIGDALATAQQSILTLGAQASRSTGAAAAALREAAYARAENAWLTSVAVSGPNVTVSELNRIRGVLSSSTVAGLAPDQKAQWTQWVNSYIADWQSRGHGGGGVQVRRFLSNVLDVPGGALPASLVDDPTYTPYEMPMRGHVDYGLM